MTPEHHSHSPAGTHIRDRRDIMTPPQRRAGLVATAILFLGGVLTLRDFLPALVWAAIFAIAVWPLFQRLARRWPQHRRATLPSLFVLGVLLGFVVPVVLVAVPLIADAHAAAQWFARVQQTGIEAPAFLAHLPFGDQMAATWHDQFGRPGQLSLLVGHGAQGSMLRIARVVGAQAIHRSMLLLFMLLTLFFLLRDAEDIMAQLRIGATRAFGPAGENVGRQVIRSVHGTVDGLVLVGLGEGLLIGIAYWVAGVPQAALFGLVTALLAMVPFGAPFCVYLAGAVLLAQGNVIGGIGVVVAGLVVIFIADHAVRPLLIGGATRLPFVWVLLGVLGGVETWGLVGLFVGPAIMAALILLWREWIGSQAGPINPWHADGT